MALVTQFPSMCLAGQFSFTVLSDSLLSSPTEVSPQSHLCPLFPCFPPIVSLSFPPFAKPHAVWGNCSLSRMSWCYAFYSSGFFFPELEPQELFSFNFLFPTSSSYRYLRLEGGCSREHWAVSSLVWQDLAPGLHMSMALWVLFWKVMVRAQPASPSYCEGKKTLLCGYRKASHKCIVSQGRRNWVP